MSVDLVYVVVCDEPVTREHCKGHTWPAVSPDAARLAARLRYGWHRDIITDPATRATRTVDACPPCHEARGSRTTSTEEIQP